jgi:hypothetical protein
MAPKTSEDGESAENAKTHKDARSDRKEIE